MEDSNFFNELKNDALSFFALADLSCEYRCWLWDEYLQVVIFDGFVILVSTYVCRRSNGSRHEMLLLMLRKMSSVYFGTRVRFVSGSRGDHWYSPMWSAPGNRLPERFKKSKRGS